MAFNNNQVLQKVAQWAADTLVGVIPDQEEMMAAEAAIRKEVRLAYPGGARVPAKVAVALLALAEIQRQAGEAAAVAAIDAMVEEAIRLEQAG